MRYIGNKGIRTFLDELDKGLVFGFCLMYPACGIIERIGRDWDWIWIDAQHGELRLIVSSSDVSIIAKGSREIIEQIRTLVDTHTDKPQKGEIGLY